MYCHSRGVDLRVDEVQAVITAVRYSRGSSLQGYKVNDVHTDRIFIVRASSEFIYDIILS